MEKRTRRKNRLLKMLASPIKKGLSALIFFVSNLILLALFCGTIFLSIIFRTRLTVNLCIIFSSIICSFITVLLTLIWVPVLRKRIIQEESEREREIIEKDVEIQRQKNEIQLYQENELDLKRKLSLLENLTYNQPTYQNVLKLCFLNSESSSTIKQREILNERDNRGLGKVMHRAEREYDELISVINYTVSYQLGIDLCKLKITQTSRDTIIISGLSPDFTARPRFDYENFFTEFRHVKLAKDDKVKEIEIQDSDASRDIVIKKQSEYKSNFEDSYLSSKNISSESAETIKRAKDFITLLLNPIYKHVQFEDNLVSKNALPFLDYLKQEISKCKNELEHISKPKIDVMAKD